MTTQLQKLEFRRAEFIPARSPLAAAVRGEASDSGVVVHRTSGRTGMGRFTTIETSVVLGYRLRYLRDESVQGFDRGGFVITVYRDYRGSDIAECLGFRRRSDLDRWLREVKREQEKLDYIAA